MQDATIVEGIRVKYIELLDDLDERGRRRWAAVEARAGSGGITTVALATGLSDRTIRTGLKELDDPDALRVIANGEAAAVASLMRPCSRDCRRHWIG
jgi:hypothetical protein